MSKSTKKNVDRLKDSCRHDRLRDERRHVKQLLKNGNYEEVEEMDEDLLEEEDKK